MNVIVKPAVKDNEYIISCDCHQDRVNLWCNTVGLAETIEYVIAHH